MTSHNLYSVPPQRTIIQTTGLQGMHEAEIVEWRVRRAVRYPEQDQTMLTWNSQASVEIPHPLQDVSPNSPFQDGPCTKVRCPLSLEAHLTKPPVPTPPRINVRGYPPQPPLLLFCTCAIIARSKNPAVSGQRSWPLLPYANSPF